MKVIYIDTKFEIVKNDVNTEIDEQIILNILSQEEILEHFEIYEVEEGQFAYILKSGQKLTDYLNKTNRAKDLLDEYFNNEL